MSSFDLVPSPSNTSPHHPHSVPSSETDCTIEGGGNPISQIIFNLNPARRPKLRFSDTPSLGKIIGKAANSPVFATRQQITPVCAHTLLVAEFARQIASH